MKRVRLLIAIGVMILIGLGVGMIFISRSPCYRFAEQNITSAALAFESDCSGNIDIYVLPPRQAHPLNVTQHPAEDVNPTWSPDGQRLAFLSNRHGNYSLFVVNADGSMLRQLTDTAIDVGAPRWSPDGALLAFASRQEHSFDLCVIQVDTGKITLISSGAAFDAPVWSPDGRWLAFVGAQPTGHAAIYAWDRSANRINPLFLDVSDGGPSNLEWSPHGPYLVFEEGDELQTLQLGDRVATRLVRLQAPAYTPQWAPNGQLISFVSTNVLYIVQRDGLALSDVAQVAETEDPGGNVFVTESAWSPDGDWLAYGVMRGIRAGAQKMIYIIHPDGTMQTPLVYRGWKGVWSPKQS